MTKKPALAVDAGAGFCYNNKAAKQNTVGGVLKWSKRRDSKSCMDFGSWVSDNLGMKPLFLSMEYRGKRLSLLYFSPKDSLAFHNFISGAVLKWSKRRDSKSRRTARLPGFKSLLLRQTEGTDEFLIRLSPLFCRRTVQICTLCRGVCLVRRHPPD